MNGYLGIGTDYHGEYKTLDNHLARVPPGTDLRFLGDMIGPKYPNLTDEISAQGNNYYDAYARAAKDPEWGSKFDKYEEDAIHDTDNILHVLNKHSITKHIGIIAGNNEEYQELYWDSFSGTESPTKRFINSSLDFVRMPRVDFYKDGRIVHDGDDVDAAVLMLPYIMPLGTYNYIQTALGKKTATMDFVKKAVDELKNEIIPKIIKANPRFILQLQHEPPKKSIFEPYDVPHDLDDEEIYELVMDELSKLVEEAGYRTEKYTIMYGHIQKRGSLKQTINHKGRRINTEHIEEGKGIRLYDTRTGETVEPWEIDEEFEIEVGEGDLETEETLEEAVEAEMAETA